MAAGVAACAALALAGGMPARPAAAEGDGALRFFGTGADRIDRVTIKLDDPPMPVDVAGDLTVEFWMKAEAGANRSGDCRPSSSAGDNWIYGNIVVDRDVFFGGDHGDYGIALYGGNGGTIGFGVAVGESGATLCGGANVADGQWHHVAATRAEAGPMALFVDGRLAAQGNGAAGDISYRDGRSTDYENDPYLVFGAEKHDAGSDYPSFHGWLDEVRISNAVRYSADFERPAPRFEPDAQTVALYHFDEGTGTALGDSSGAAGGPSNGEVRVGGPSAGPVWDAGVSVEIPLPTTVPPTTAPGDPSATTAPTDPTVAEPSTAPTSVDPSATTAPGEPTTTADAATTSITPAPAFNGSDDPPSSSSSGWWAAAGAVLVLLGIGAGLLLRNRRGAPSPE